MAERMIPDQSVRAEREQRGDGLCSPLASRVGDTKVGWKNRDGARPSVARVGVGTRRVETPTSKAVEEKRSFSRLESRRGKRAQRAARPKLHIDDGCMGGGGDYPNPQMTIIDPYSYIDTKFNDQSSFDIKRENVFKYGVLIGQMGPRHRTDFPYGDSAFMLSRENDYHKLNKQHMKNLLTRNIASSTFAEEDWDGDGMVNIVDIDPFIKNEKWALLMAGVDNPDEGEGVWGFDDYELIKADLYETYDILIDNGWEDGGEIDHIRILSELGKYPLLDPFVDDDSTLSNINDEFKCLINNVDKNDIIFIYIRGHMGIKDDKTFFAPSDYYQSKDRLFSTDVNSKLNDIQQDNEKIVLVAEGCFSGDFVTKCKHDNRLILSSTSRKYGSISTNYLFGRYNTDDHFGTLDNEWGAQANADLLQYDGNNNRHISIEEAHILNADHLLKDEVSHIDDDDNLIIQNPYMDDQIVGDIYLSMESAIWGYWFQENL